MSHNPGLSNPGPGTHPSPPLAGLGGKRPCTWRGRTDFICSAEAPVFRLRATPVSEGAAATPGTPRPGSAEKGAAARGDAAVVGRCREFRTTGVPSNRFPPCYLHLSDVLSLQTLHHGVYRFLHPELLQLRHGDPALHRVAPASTWTPHTGPPPRRRFPGQSGRSFPGPRRRLALERSNCTPDGRAPACCSLRAPVCCSLQLPAGLSSMLTSPWAAEGCFTRSPHSDRARTATAFLPSLSAPPSSS